MRESAGTSITNAPTTARAIRATATLALLLALTLAFASGARAAAVHPFIEARDGSNTPSGEFDKACGVAVDTKGNTYVANSGNSSIDVFDPAGAYLTSIADGNGPCDIAVDSKGNVFVVDSSTSNVVKFSPQGGTFPPTAGLSYEGPTTFDSSGEASGVAVNTTNDRVYVATPEWVSVYLSNGTLFKQSEIQKYRTVADGGTYTLTLGSETTAPIPAGASFAQVTAALEGLAAIDPGEVAVSGEIPTPDDARYTVTFQNGLANTSEPGLVLDGAGLTYSKGQVSITYPTTVQQGTNGRIGEGTLSEGFGVGVWSARGDVSVSDETGTVFVFDEFGSRLITEIDGTGAPGGAFGTLPEASLAVDQSNGHLFVSDIEGGGAVYEFESRGLFLSTMARGDFEDADPADVAVDSTQGTTAGQVYVTGGAGPGAEVFVFGPLPPPDRGQLPLNLEVKGACGVAVDSAGNLYVAGSQGISVFAPSGTLLLTIPDSGRPCDPVVDSSGVVYAVDANTNASFDEEVVRYTPASFPPTAATIYSAPATVVAAGEDGLASLQAIGLNQANGHLFVAGGDVNEYDSAANGSGLLIEGFASSLVNATNIADVGVDSAGRVYLIKGEATNSIFIVAPGGGELLQTISGTNSPFGIFGSVPIAIDPANSHILLSTMLEGRTDEFEASGSYLASFGSFAKGSERIGSIGVDSSSGPTKGNIYVAYKNKVIGFGPLSYGEGPSAVTGFASAVGGGTATLNGTVNPNGFPLTECNFEYTDQASFGSEGFTGATTIPCAETLAEIGLGKIPVAVHADLTGLDTSTRYRYRLTAKNKFDESFGAAGVFGPPIVSAVSATPVHYTEATLRATIDPSGLPTTYHFEYGLTEAYGQSTPAVEIAAGADPVSATAPLFGLSEGGTYHFRVVAENSAETVVGGDLSFTTLQRQQAPQCPNSELRGGASAHLPDCRAYEQVTPDTNGLRPGTLNGTDGFESGAFETPMATADGESVIFDTAGSIPGTDANGGSDRYRVTRGGNGWATEILSPTGVEAERPTLGGSSEDHLYSFWNSGSKGSLASGGETTTLLGKPDGTFELIGRGSEGADPKALGFWIAPGGSHVVFATGYAPPAVQLQPNAPPSGIGAIYDRELGGATQVVSLLPGDVTPSESAHYEGISDDGTAIAFEVGGVLYVRHDQSETIELGFKANFAGASADGDFGFFVQGGDIFRAELATGAITPVGSGGKSTIVNVSADGSHVYFVSEEQLDGSEGSPGANNLYVWDEGAVSYITEVSEADLNTAFFRPSLAEWIIAVGLSKSENGDWGAFTGRGMATSRTTPDGTVFVFQSTANQTGYDSNGRSEIYRFDSADGDVECISCLAGGVPSGHAELQQVNIGLEPEKPGESREISPLTGLSRVTNVTPDGEAIFFQSPDPLVAADDNGTVDVYEWNGGVVSLISTGKSKLPSYLYGMSIDGRDVFIMTNESLLPSDTDGGVATIYDARVNGGFAGATTEAPCLGDTCQGNPATPPSLTPPTTSQVQGSAEASPPRRRCPKSERAVKRKGKVRCVPRKKKPRHGKRSAGANRKGGQR